MNTYVKSLLEKGIRLDNRKMDEYRKIKVELDVSKNAEGSARVKIGKTEVVAGVKMDVGEPYLDSPNDGVLIVGAELVPLSNPEFELGPPDENAIELARIVDRGIRESKCIDMSKLCIKKGSKVWIIFIDIYPINDDGNLIDASALASIIALKNVRIPEYDEKKDIVKYGKKTKKTLPLCKIPIACTLGKIGDKILVDCCLEEEKSLDSRLTITLCDDYIHAMQKGGNKGLMIKDMDKMIDIAIKKSAELRKLI